ncbi:hypothetical protein [Salinisphaera sp. Q1T1-3]|uniref:hypothetical protein n=1 Tax=Salinisphaera sp. Q1T1-3 TaxID=2321229 RepID=UPI0011C40571|nr:hypothetical protein [Salinisphaera sp. Q1T1-3]
MSEVEGEEVGFIKYRGESVLPGILDAGKAGQALTGLDDALRFFNAKQSSKLAKSPYEVPVRVEEGSWEAIVIAGASMFAAAYFGTAGKKMAERDFGGVGFKDVFQSSLKAIRHLVRLVKHTRRTSGWDLDNVRWREDNTEIGIRNSRGEFEYFPATYVKWYLSASPGLLRKLVEVVERERTLIVGTIENGKVIEEQVDLNDKAAFVGEESPDNEGDFLFPELEHGQEVELEGRLTRGNASTNSLGFEYAGHVLNCYPEEGSIVRFKPVLFLRCLLYGEVSRLGDKRFVTARRPTLIIKRVTPLEEDAQRSLW